MGIHTDVCTVGNFGSSDRLDYTVLGNGVNLASRLESMAEANQILISENTHNLINEDIESQFFSEITAKGKAHPVKAYQVSGIVSKKIKEEVIKASEEGFELRLDRKKIKNKDQVLSILEKSIDKLSS
jgi:adenylate cyclase